jgi:hypothetical protein
MTFYQALKSQAHIFFVRMGFCKTMIFEMGIKQIFKKNILLSAH